MYSLQENLILFKISYIIIQCNMMAFRFYERHNYASHSPNANALQTKYLTFYIVVGLGANFLYANILQF